MLSNQDGTLNASNSYYPYGGNRGGAHSTLTAKRFTGQYHEAGLPGSEGLYYYNARWYDPQLARFAQADSIVPDPAAPQALNRYMYTLGNPLRYTDPTGHRVVQDNSGGLGCETGASLHNCIYPVGYPLAGRRIGTTQADVERANAGMKLAAEAIVGIVWEPADWAFTINYWRQGDFSYWDLLGLLPVIPAAGVRAARHADGVAGVVKRLESDLYAFGNRSGPRPPRPGKDVMPDTNGNLSPQTPPFPDGASTFADPLNAPATGHYHKLPAGTELPSGLGVVADGLDVSPGSPHPATHHTIFNTIEMAFGRFVELFSNLPWHYGGKK